MATWTATLKRELVEFVDKAIAQGKPKMQAYEEFVAIKGLDVSPITISVQYSRAKKAPPEKLTPEKPTGIAYDEKTDRLIVLSSHFASNYGLKKRDVYRVIADKLKRTLVAIEQRANILAKRFDLPDQCPPDIAKFLKELSANASQPDTAILDAKPMVIQETPVVYSADMSARPKAKSIQVEPVAPSQAEDMDILDALTRFAKATQHIEGIDGEKLLKQLSVLATMAADRSEIGNLRNRLYVAERRNERLEHDLRQTREENEVLRAQLIEFNKKLEEIKQQQEVVNFIVSEFASIRTIEQVGALKDFTNKFRIEVDKLGNVVRSVDEWKEKYAQQLRQIYAEKDDK